MERKTNFKLPERIDYDSAFRLVTDELNLLWAEVRNLAQRPRHQRQQGPVMCGCDVEYIGGHWPHCSASRGSR